MQASYGTVPRDPGAPRVKPKISTMAKVIPCVFLCLYIPMVLLASHILRAEEQEEQNMYAIEQDELFNRSIPFVEWQGDHWIDEATGKIVKLPCFLPDGSKCSGNDYKEDRELDREVLDGDSAPLRAPDPAQPPAAGAAYDPDGNNPVVRTGRPAGRKP